MNLFLIQMLLRNLSGILGFVLLGLVSSIFLRLTAHASTHQTVLAQRIVLDGEVAKWTFIEKGAGANWNAQPGKSLIPQLPTPSRCCSGTYRTVLNLKRLNLMHEKDHQPLSYSILVPVTGGLREVTLDEFTVPFPNRDYSSIETLVPVPPNLLNRDHVMLSIDIDSPPSFYAGMWNNSPLLGATEALLETRDRNFAFQIIIPYFLAIFLLVFAAIFVWCWRQVPSRDPLYGEFAATLACWGVYYLFLAGQVRAWHPFFGGMFHMPMRLVAVTALMRVVSIFAGIPRSYLKRLTAIGIVLGLTQIVTNLIYLENLQPFLFIPFGLFIVYANIRMWKSIKRRLDWIVFATSTIASVGFLSDTIRIASTFFDFDYPIFYLNRYSTPPLLLTSVVYLAYKLSREAEISVKQKAYEQVSSQVAHDIKSPLAALAMAEHDLQPLPEDTRIMVRSAVARIQDIANQLLDKTQLSSVRMGTLAPKPSNDFKFAGPHLLHSAVDRIASEKRLQFRTKIRLEIETMFAEGSHGLFVSVQLTELKRVLSNLINNAIEALPNYKGKVLLEIKVSNNQEQQIEIRIQDNGKGIPPHILERLGQEKLSFDKVNGFGLGLYHAKRAVEDWNGSIKIESTVGIGTAVILTLPRSKPPAWFVEEIVVMEGTQIAVLDDDESIHKIWKSRFGVGKHDHPKIELHHFSTPQDIIQWSSTRANARIPMLYLVDYELLNHPLNGLDVIEQLKVADQAILVTSRYEELSIRKRCEQLNTQLIPKETAGFVPIRITLESSSFLTRFDAVLVDDDAIVRMTWKKSAKTFSKEVGTFADAQSFLSIAPRIAPSTPIYLDSHLGSGSKGEEIAKDIWALGFSNIYLATGFNPKEFDLKGMPWIKAIVGKDPPWGTISN